MTTLHTVEPTTRLTCGRAGVGGSAKAAPVAATCVAIPTPRLTRDRAGLKVPAEAAPALLQAATLSQARAEALTPAVIAVLAMALAPAQARALARAGQRRRTATGAGGRRGGTPAARAHRLARAAAAAAGVVTIGAVTRGHPRLHLLVALPLPLLSLPLLGRIQGAAAAAVCPSKHSAAA
jgi:hypothetical protein